MCQKPSAQKFHPFCSSRCAARDLSRWLGGHYAIPAVEEDDGSELKQPEQDG